MSSLHAIEPENTIAFMGVAGANADLACRQAAPYMHTLPCASFEDVFEAVAEGRAQLGMIPIENSQAGRVAEIHNILPRSNLHIVGEYFQAIEHCLMAPQNASLETVRQVYSHPQGLLQCRERLREMKLEAHPHANTALAAKDVAAWNDLEKAAIASPLAAERYGLQILKPHMQDADDNVTVFIILAKKPIDPEPEDGARILTTLLFSIRNIPAALYKAMGGFATNGINIVKLESYIPGGKGASHNSSQFFLSFEGHPREKRVQNALEELGFFTRKVQVLGVYPAAPERFE